MSLGYSVYDSDSKQKQYLFYDLLRSKGQLSNFASPAAASLALVFRKQDHRGPK